jgi:hypothetical protein
MVSLKKSKMLALEHLCVCGSLLLPCVLIFSIALLTGGKGKAGGKRKGASEEEPEEEVLGYISSRCFWNSLPSPRPSLSTVLSQAGPQPRDQV